MLEAVKELLLEVKNFVPAFKKNDYLAYLRNLSKEEEFSYKNLKI